MTKPDTRQHGRRSAFMVAGVLALVLSSPPAIADSGDAPAFVRQLGGPGRADIYPSGVEVDPGSGAVVVADTGNDRVAKYGAGGSNLWDVGGFGSALGKYDSPRDVGIDESGNVYVADTGNSRIVKLNGATGAPITSWKGSGADKIGSPLGVSVSNDLVYVADASKKQVRIYQLTGTLVRSFGQAGTCTFSALRDVDADSSGNVYIANYLQNDILKMTATGGCLTKWGSKGTGDGQFKNPYGVSVAYDPVDGAERVYVADSNNNRIQKFTLTGTFRQAMGQTGSGDANFGGLRRVAVDASGRVYGADLWGWKIGRYAWNGSAYAFDRTYPAPVVPPAGELDRPITDTSMFNNVNQVAFEADGDLWAMDTVNQRAIPLRNVASGQLNGTPCGKRGWQAGAFNWPRGIAIDHATGNLWIADTKQSRLQVMSTACTSPAFIGSVGSGSTQFNWPYSLAIRQSDHVVFVADTRNHRVKAYNASTRALIDVFGTTGAGTGQFAQPSGIAVGPGGDVFVADRGNKRVVRLTFAAGNFSWGGTFGPFSGTDALLRPEGVAADGQNVYIADPGKNRMVVVDRASGTVRGIVTGPGTLDTPQSVSVDADGCVYLSDSYHDRILVYRYAGSCT
jgi:DNA-binding beta-propeller fold protein YncE